MRVAALLRGINIGPHKRIAMPALRGIVESLGHTDVETYLQSGNVVFTRRGRTDPGPVLRFCFAKRDETLLAAAERLRKLRAEGQ